MAYYRSSNSVPPVVKNLLIANVIVFFARWVFGMQGKALEPFGALHDWDSPFFGVWQLVTHMFMHGSIFHILFNMLGLWMFGTRLEQVWGPKRFFQFYMICGIVAGVAQMLLESNFRALGASGAVMGVFAGFAYLFPDEELFFMFIPIPIKAKWAIPGLMALDLFGAIYRQPGDQTAHWAHLGGELAGLVLVLIWGKRNRRTF